MWTLQWCAPLSDDAITCCAQAADAALFGTSPKGSFNHEMAHWMEVSPAALLRMIAFID